LHCDGDNVAENGPWFLLPHIDRMGNLQCFYEISDD
jgi:hypothetical protein